MKKYLILSLAALALLSGCKKDNDGDATAFTATIEQSGDKTTLGSNNYPNWVQGDKIKIEAVEFSASTVNGTTATFTSSNTVTAGADGKYHAYYPADIYDGTTVTLPAIQTYDATANGIGNLPMYAESTGHNLVFKNLCGVLAITVQQSQMTTVKSITVKANGKRLNGAFTVSGYSTNNPTINFSSPSTSNAADTMVTLLMETAVEIPNGGQTFYIAIPAATDYTTLTIEVMGKFTEGGTEKTTAKRMRTNSTPKTIARNTIYSIPFSGSNVTSGTALVKSASGRTTCDWVQLWDGGPLWATVNVGATISDHNNLSATAETVRGGSSISNYTTANVGGLYCWGGKTFTNFRVGTGTAQDGENADYYYSDAIGNIAGTDRDIAKGLWGSNWRMPTQAELNKLKNSTYCTWPSGFDTKGTSPNTIQGRTVTGAGTGYNSNSIFLPAAGYFFYSSLCNVGAHGYCWSSMPCDDEYEYCAYGLNFPNRGQYVDVEDCGNGYSVRAVLAVD